MGVPVCQQPFLIDFRVDDFARRLGEVAREYLPSIAPLRTMQSEGVPLAIGADVPAFPSMAPLDSIRCAMERRTGKGRQLDDDESVSFLDALRIHTIGNAYAAFDERELGSLEPGKAADFVIWNRDLREMQTGRDVATLRVQATYVAGRRV
jgi:predicted amidohydrolase YtcJ